MAGKRIVDPEHKVKMVILRGMGFSQVEIAERFGVTRSAVSKQLSRIRKSCKESDEEFQDEWGFLRKFFELMLYSEDLDYSSIIALGNQKYTYENLRFQGMSRTQSLNYSRSNESVQNAPWILNPNFDGSHISARESLWRKKQ